MNHAVATALLGSKSLTDDAIHEAWRLQVARNPDRLEMLNTAKDGLVKNVRTVLKTCGRPPISPQTSASVQRTCQSRCLSFMQFYQNESPMHVVCR